MRYEIYKTQKKLCNKIWQLISFDLAPLKETQELDISKQKMYYYYYFLRNVPR